ncbi:hypothetical protein [Sorangium sp. So ce1078]|uniref:hypothetical protein n=1 Tax=Sorangium sp. So ce1078 TaxID=3133329 RepID=UPI003F616FE8
MSVELDAERGETDVYLREDVDDLEMQVIPEAHLGYIELMKRDGWEIDEEEALRVWLMHRIGVSRRRWAGLAELTVCRRPNLVHSPSVLGARSRQPHTYRLFREC